MKVVCIKIPNTIVKIKLEIGKIYHAFLLNQLMPHWYIKDEWGQIIPCRFNGPDSCFILLDELRQIKLRELEV